MKKLQSTALPADYFTLASTASSSTSTLVNTELSDLDLTIKGIIDALALCRHPVIPHPAPEFKKLRRCNFEFQPNESFCYFAFRHLNNLPLSHAGEHQYFCQCKYSGCPW